MAWGGVRPWAGSTPEGHADQKPGLKTCMTKVRGNDYCSNTRYRRSSCYTEDWAKNLVARPFLRRPILGSRRRHSHADQNDASVRLRYLAHLSEIGTEISRAKKTSADEVFKILASLPREKVSEQIKRMI